MTQAPKTVFYNDASSGAAEPGATAIAVEDSNLPPPPAARELLDTRPPHGQRTPAGPARPRKVEPLPDGSPEWTVRARRLSEALEEAIGGGAPSPSLQACIDRAWSAWELGDYTDAQICKVSRLIERAHVAIRQTPDGPKLEQAYHDAAHVMWAAFPARVRATVDFQQVVELVRQLRCSEDAWSAVVEHTSMLLGWKSAAIAFAAHAIRVAMWSEYGV